MLALVSLAIASSALVAAQGTITAAPSPTQISKAKRQASSSPLPLTEYHFSYSDVPYQVNPYPVGRGPQSGYNQCNSTTEGPNSLCQTLVANNISDFCLWGSPVSDGLIGNVEAEVVAYCTSPKWGARLIPEGAITGLQVMHTSQYTQWTGFIDQTALGLNPTDYGGELDPHGADNLGNPLGGLVFSNDVPTLNGTGLQQVISWNNFVGSGEFCLKLCGPMSYPNYCENRFDLIGCAYNMPAAYQNGTFLECDGDLQDVVGTYTGSNGQTTTWSQPESLPATSTLPWTPRIPASSNCKTYQSSDLFAAYATSSSSASASTATKDSHSSSARSTGVSGSAAASTGSRAAAAASASTSTSSKSSTSGASPAANSVAGGLLAGLVAGALAIFA